MRNIYDIIAEQKALVDVEICSYELKYLAEEFDYLQEGVGETLKNVGSKIIEFIKKVIAKIKELIGKVVNFFRGKKNGGDSIQKIDDEIKAGKKKDVKDSSKEHEELADKINKRKEMRAEQNKEEKEKRDQEAEQQQKRADELQKQQDAKKAEVENRQKEEEAKKEKKASDLNDALKKSERKVNMVRYASLDDRKELTQRFFNKLTSLINTQMRLSDNDAAVDSYFAKELINGAFVKNGSVSKAPKATITERIRLELNETGEEAEYNVKDLADIITSYKDFNSIGSYVQSMGAQAIDELEKLKRKLEQMENVNNNVRKPEVIVRYVNEFTNAMCTSVVKAHQAYLQVSKKIQDDVM